ncbi:MAG: U32 family peptidase, partial [Desulfobacterales bacterium]|nr:U32 family peptidase [Desulfobacterales bacterium]
DLGLLEIDLPPIPLIASTQMNNNTLEKINFLGKIGFVRVILPREFNISQIKYIKENSSIELECFIHGSLCVSYSGQCYLSYSRGKRSANRGSCAQPCRLPYSLIDKNGSIISNSKYLLSLKDLNLSENIIDLIDAGITSFKIEGRLKDKYYVANIVSFYRKKLDTILEIKKTSSGKSRIDFVPDLYKTFNRGYTKYFIFGRSKEMASLHTPKSRGEYIGRVSKIGEGNFRVDNPKILFHSGDGICFFDKNNNLIGTNINKIDGGSIYPDKILDIRMKQVIYRNYDSEFIKAIKKSKFERKIEINLKFLETEDGFALYANDEDGNCANAKVNVLKEIAQKKEQSITTIKKQLQKLGDTYFLCLNIIVETKESYFIPLNILNALRRECIDNLILVRAQNRPKFISKITKSDIPYPEASISYLGNVLNKKSKNFYNRHGVFKIEDAIESAGGVLENKKLMTTKYCILYEIGYCKKEKKHKKIDEPIYLVDENSKKYLIKTNCSVCEMEVIHD